MDGEAIGVAYQDAMAAGSGVKGCVQLYSKMRCEISGKVVIANRGMGPTAVPKEAKEKCEGMSKEEKEKWCNTNGAKMYEEQISAYRKSMPASVRPVKKARTIACGA